MGCPTPVFCFEHPDPGGLVFCGKLEYNGVDSLLERRLEPAENRCVSG